MSSWSKTVQDVVSGILRADDAYLRANPYPDFAAAYAGAAACYQQRCVNRWMIDRSQEIPEAVRLARQAVGLGRDDALALCTGGSVLDNLGSALPETPLCQVRSWNATSATNHPGPQVRPPATFYGNHATAPQQPG